MSDAHEFCVDGGERCVPLTIEDTNTGNRHHIAWLHQTFRIVHEDVLSGEKKELDPLIALAEGATIKFKVSDYKAYPVWVEPA